MIGFFRVCGRWNQKIIPVNWGIIKYKIFLYKYWSVSFLIIGFRVRGIKKTLGATRNYGRWLKAVKLTKIILFTVMLEKILSINVLGLAATLLGCRIWG